MIDNISLAIKIVKTENHYDPIQEYLIEMFQYFQDMIQKHK
jgi:hypothetical protein